MNYLRQIPVGFPDKVSIPLGKTAVCRAKGELMQKGYIIVFEGKSSARAAEYVLFALDPNTLRGQKEE